MRRRLRSALALCRRFAGSTRGVTAVEFAIVLPAMLFLLLGGFDAANAIAIYIKVRSATATLTAVTNQYKTIHDADMQQILGATSVVLSPYSSGNVDVVVSQLQVTSNKKAKVDWSDALNGTAHAVGSKLSIPNKIAPKNSYLVFCEVSYRYTPMFNFFISGPITLSDSLYTTPRSTASIARTAP